MVPLISPLLGPKYSHYDVISPLQAAKILIFSQNDHDFRTQRPKNVRNSLEWVFLGDAPPY